jgi:hypothetical protein
MTEPLHIQDYDDFDTIEANPEPSYQFTLGGRLWNCRQPGDIHWDTIEKFMKAQGSGDMLGVVTHMDEFFSAVLFPDEVVDFLALKRDPLGGLTTDRMTKLIQRVSEKVLNRPTQPSSASSDGRQKKTPTSRASSSSRAIKARTA